MFPNVQYAANGYDIVNGNPFANTVDPGWRIAILELTYVQGRNWDNTFACPDWGSATPKDSCSYMGTSYVMTTSSSYQVRCTEGALLSVAVVAQVPP